MILLILRQRVSAAGGSHLENQPFPMRKESISLQMEEEAIEPEENSGNTLFNSSRHYGLEIHMSHFPPGTSKWNKIEHRLFCFISKNWQGKPLIDIETIII